MRHCGEVEVTLGRGDVERGDPVRAELERSVSVGVVLVNNVFLAVRLA